jgi:bacterioferritin-associated ferredoxin
MIVCVCNRISDKAVKEIACSGECRSVGELFRCLGCRVQCGKCVPEMRRQFHGERSVAQGSCSAGEPGGAAGRASEDEARAKAA